MKNKIILDSEMLNSEVLYIGQSIGKCNPSNAYKRLKNHATLQQILAETLENEPYNDILLNLDNPTLINFTTSKFKGKQEINNFQDINNFVSIDYLSKKEIVTLMETCLIKYFMPYYNKLLKRDFSNVEKFLKKCQK